MKKIWSKKHFLNVLVGASISLAVGFAAWDLWDALGRSAGDSAAESISTHAAE
jgi:hypothetical protein